VTSSIPGQTTDYYISLSHSQALAQQLQHEEDARAHALHIEQQRRREEQERRQAAENDAAQNYGSIGNLEPGMANLEVQPEKKKRDCIIM
jgi:hypothetical protein